MDDNQWETANAEMLAHGFAEDSGRRRINDHRDLTVWQTAMDLAVKVYKASAGFPRSELYGLTSQLRRAAVSISANIAEGYGRDSTGAYTQFLRIAQGSARETQSLIELAMRLEFIPPQSGEPLEQQAISISKMLRSLIRSIEHRVRRH